MNRHSGCTELETLRLLLRCWRTSDLEPFSAMNRDPRVVEFLGRPLTREQSDALVERIEDGFERDGFGLWAVEVPGVAPFVGFVGLSVPAFDAPFMPAVEIGWRLDPRYWGAGYATEAACRALEYGFDVVGLEEIVSFCAVGNARSRGVMERIGMSHDARDDFDHPQQAPDGPLSRHLLYHIRPHDPSRAQCAGFPSRRVH